MVNEVQISITSAENVLKYTYLLELEDVLVNEMLQFLAGKVNAQLLKTVGLEVLESKHVQDTEGQTLK